MTFKDDMERMRGVRMGTVRPWEDGMRSALAMETRIAKADDEEPERWEYSKWRKALLRELREKRLARGEPVEDFLRGAFQGYIRPALLSTYVDAQGNVRQARPRGREELPPRAPESPSGYKYYNFGWRPVKTYETVDGEGTASSTDPRIKRDMFGDPIHLDQTYIMSSEDKEREMERRSAGEYDRFRNEVLSRLGKYGISNVVGDLSRVAEQLKRVSSTESVSEVDELMDEWIRSEAAPELRVVYNHLKDRLPNDVTGMLLGANGGPAALANLTPSTGSIEGDLGAAFDRVDAEVREAEARWRDKDRGDMELAGRLAEHLVERALAGDAPAFLNRKDLRHYIGKNGKEYTNYPISRMVDDAFDHSQRIVRNILYDEKGRPRVGKEGVPLMESMSADDMIKGYQTFLNRKEGTRNASKTRDMTRNAQAIQDMMDDVDSDVKAEFTKAMVDKLHRMLERKMKKAEEEGGTYSPSEFWGAIERQYPGSVDLERNRLKSLTTKLMSAMDPGGRIEDRIRNERIDQIKNTMRLDPEREGNMWSPYRADELGQNALANHMGNMSDEQLSDFFEALRSKDADVMALLQRIGMDDVPTSDEVTSPQLREMFEKADRLAREEAWMAHNQDRDETRRRELSDQLGYKDRILSWDEMYDSDWMAGMETPVSRYQSRVSEAFPELKGRITEELVAQAKADGTYNPKKTKAKAADILARIGPEGAGTLAGIGSEVFGEGVTELGGMPLYVPNAQGVDILNPDITNELSRQSKIMSDRSNFDPETVRRNQEKQLKGITAYLGGDRNALRGSKPVRISDETLEFLHPSLLETANRYNALVDTWTDDEGNVLGDAYDTNNPFQVISDKDMRGMMRAFRIRRDRPEVPSRFKEMVQAYHRGLNRDKDIVNRAEIDDRNDWDNIAARIWNQRGKKFSHQSKKVQDHYMNAANPEYRSLFEAERTAKNNLNEARKKGDAELVKSAKDDLATIQEDIRKMMESANRSYLGDRRLIDDMGSVVESGHATTEDALRAVPLPEKTDTGNPLFNLHIEDWGSGDVPGPEDYMTPTTDVPKSPEDKPSEQKPPGTEPPEVRMPSSARRTMEEAERQGYVGKSGVPTLREMMGMFALQKEGHPYGEPMFGDIAPVPGEEVTKLFRVKMPDKEE